MLKQFHPNDNGGGHFFVCFWAHPTQELSLALWVSGNHRVPGIKSGWCACKASTLPFVPSFWTLENYFFFFFNIRLYQSSFPTFPSPVSQIHLSHCAGIIHKTMRLFFKREKERITLKVGKRNGSMSESLNEGSRKVGLAP